MNGPGRAGWPRPPAATTAAAALQLARQLIVERGWAQRIATDNGTLDALSALAVACGHEPGRPISPSRVFVEALDYVADAIGYTGEQPVDALIVANDCATHVAQVLEIFDRAAALALPIPAVSR